jgi:hypothetical protein
VTTRGLGRRSPGRRIAGGLAGILLAASVLAGCSAVRSNLGTSDSPCYLSLAAASQAVHGSGKLAGVHLFTLTRLHEKAPRLYARLAISHPSQDRICVIEFTGTFTDTSVARPLGSPAGRLAVVVLRTPSNQLLGTVLLDHPPLHFGHGHVG